MTTEVEQATDGTGNELVKDLPSSTVMRYIQQAIGRIYVNDSRCWTGAEIQRIVARKVEEAIESYRHDQMPDRDFEVVGTVSFPFTVTVTAKSEEDAEETLTSDVASYIDEDKFDWFSVDVEVHGVTAE